MTDIKIGDRVEITEYRSYDDECNGWTGVVVQIDNDGIPYLVRTEEEGDVWAVNVRKLDTAASLSRDDLVARAKAHLTGTPHTADDIIRLAEFLAG
ncbi:hypothetical protein [Streptomyces sp. NBC_01212]|uniref:hypothetical protein n=1 Tax=Streptomyces sp. NBC_01212 TaxID=2903775 RepID=UPI002E14256F|nr:hypothetical protein OG722_04925 [Streptomyces sp. NBC_01212]